MLVAIFKGSFLFASFFTGSTLFKSTRVFNALLGEGIGDTGGGSYGTFALTAFDDLNTAMVNCQGQTSFRVA
uniref:hypothetical protein n=1 Tax=Desulfosporosinus nitroreducens TaxID=2018668 RepID=UPI00207D1E6C|nr:hypothetical protein [Desulfosporosinus nitroreducens]